MVRTQAPISDAAKSSDSDRNKYHPGRSPRGSRPPSLCRPVFAVYAVVWMFTEDCAMAVKPVRHGIAASLDYLRVSRELDGGATDRRGFGSTEAREGCRRSYCAQHRASRARKRASTGAFQPASAQERPQGGYEAVRFGRRDVQLLVSEVVCEDDPVGSRIIGHHGRRREWDIDGADSLWKRLVLIVPDIAHIDSHPVSPIA